MDIPSLLLKLTTTTNSIAILISLVIFYYAFKGNKNKAGNNKKIDGESPQWAPEPAGAWPVIGHLHLLSGKDQLLYRTLGKMADSHGSVFNLWLGSRRAFVVNSWEVAKECFTVNDMALASRPTTVAAKLMGYNYAVFGFAPYTPFWREMRKLATLELLSNRRLDLLKEVRISEIDAGMRDLYRASTVNGAVVKLSKCLEEMTLNMVTRLVAGKCFFGEAVDADEARRGKLAISDFFRLIGMFVVSDAFPFLGWLDWQGHEKAMKRTAKDLDGILVGWIEEHRRRRAASNNKQRSDDDDKDFIDVMLTLQDKGNLSNFQYDEGTSIKSTCLALILGGSDTIAGTMTWVISLLLNNPETLKRTQEELDIHVGRDRIVEDSDLKNLVYLHAVVKETLRLYPAGPLLGPREAQEDCTVAGYRVPAGTRLVVNVWKIQRDPRVWSDPEAFKPDRFLTTHAHVVERGQFELMPFGFGRRSCPGSSLALQVLDLGLARLLQGFHFANPNAGLVDMTESPGLTLPKATPLDVLLTPRLSSHLYAAV